LTLSNNNNNNNDLAELKKGVKLEDSYAQSYIPLYAVYDFKNKEYAYVFDNRYVDANENSITLNLFEIKYADDSKDTAGDDEIKDEIKDVTNGRQIVAKININEAFHKTIIKN
jgi:predicted RNA-binding protein with PIN domain